jgi:hypothetical protein
MYRSAFPKHTPQPIYLSDPLHTRTIAAMKLLVIGAVLLFAACDGRGPTAPTPPPVTVTPPVVVTPPPVAPVPTFPPHDSRFDLAFYRMFVHDAYDRRGDTAPLLRQTQAPRIYLRTIDDAGAPMDALTLNQTAAALESTAGLLTGVFGLAGLERGTETRQGQPGWITVRWSAEPSPERFCGWAIYGGDLIILYPRSPNCRCAGGPAVRLKTVKHELGHALGFRHTDSPNDLMFAGGNACDLHPSAREQYHAALAYTQPIGSLAP